MLDDIIKIKGIETTIKKYDKLIKQTLQKLHENEKNLKELSRGCVSTQSRNTWKRNLKKLGVKKGKDVA